jgi:hypothetical protein
MTDGAREGGKRREERERGRRESKTKTRKKSMTRKGGRKSRERHAVWMQSRAIEQKQEKLISG